MLYSWYFLYDLLIQWILNGELCTISHYIIGNENLTMKIFAVFLELFILQQNTRKL